MGNAPSAAEIGDALTGFRVLTLSPDSPAAHSGLEIFFDFIVAVNDAAVADMDAFLDLINRSENKKISLTVLNIRTATERRVACIPQRWSGPGLLGAALAQERVVDAYSEGLRVVQVLKASPADLAGLNPRTDYLIACSRGIFREVSDFDAAMAANTSGTSAIFVFNSIDKSVRTIHLPVPSTEGDAPPGLGLSLGQGAMDALPLEQIPVTGVSGLQILRINAGGPLASDDTDERRNFIEPIFSFITLVDGRPVASQTAFGDLLASAEADERSLTLTLWNTRLEETKEFTIRPRSDWPDAKGRLGATVKYLANMDETTGGSCAGLHVLEIFPNSPAADAGLRADSDYLLASADNILYTLSDLEALVNTDGCELTLTVFDSVSCTQRQVQIKPNSTWGGKGVLGCDLGFGAVHRVPKYPVEEVQERSSPFLQADEDTRM